MDKEKENVLKLAKENDVKFIRLWFTDILGFLKGFAITIDELEGALEEGMGFDGSSIQGYARIDESDMIARPDPKTFQIVPWRPKENAVGRMFADIYEPDGTPYKGDPRWVLRRALKRPRKKGTPFTLARSWNIFTSKKGMGEHRRSSTKAVILISLRSMWRPSFDEKPSSPWRPWAFTLNTAIMK